MCAKMHVGMTHLSPAQKMVEIAATNAVFAMNHYPKQSLYVGDLDFNVTDDQLREIFGGVGSLASVHICRDFHSRRSLGYGYVNFHSPEEAKRALDVMNYTTLDRKPIRLMYSNRDPRSRKNNQAANIFIKNLDKSINNKQLYERFIAFGDILTCKVATDSSSGRSRGFGFVQFETEESAKNAIENLNGVLLNGKKIFVGPFLPKEERERTIDKTKFNNVFIKNLSDSVTEDDLYGIFGEHGFITSAVVMKDDDSGKSKCFGFVNFKYSDDAARAVKELNGKTFDGKEWYVGRAQKKSERENELAKERAQKYHGLNLYLKNFDLRIGEDELKELFSACGNITSCKVMRNDDGTSKGFGFVTFRTAGEASLALAQMHGKIVYNKRLYVAHAELKQERVARLRAHFSTLGTLSSSVPSPSMPTNAASSSVPSPSMPTYAASSSSVPPPPFHSMPTYAASSSVPSPPFHSMPTYAAADANRFGHDAFYSQQHVPMPYPPIPSPMPPIGQNYVPSTNRMPDFYFPLLQHQHQLVQRLSQANRRMQLPMPLPQQQMHPRNVTNRFTPEQQKDILGRHLLPLVMKLEKDRAEKVTGMFLELDQAEVLHLIESPEHLKAKVSEAMEILRQHAQDQQQQQQQAVEEEPLSNAHAV